MKITYEVVVSALCPVDGLPDRYEAEIHSTAVIHVESILEVVSKISGKKMFQEDLTQELARAIGARIITVGYHSGVKTTCECS